MIVIDKCARSLSKEYDEESKGDRAMESVRRRRAREQGRDACKGARERRAREQGRDVQGSKGETCKGETCKGETCNGRMQNGDVRWRLAKTKVTNMRNHPLWVCWGHCLPFLVTPMCLPSTYCASGAYQGGCSNSVTLYCYLNFFYWSSLINVQGRLCKQGDMYKCVVSLSAPTPSNPSYIYIALVYLALERVIMIIEISLTHQCVTEALQS